jgi:hypothetical protein
MRWMRALRHGAVTNPNDDLTTTRVIGTYYFRRKYGGIDQHFSTSGSVDRAVSGRTRPGRDHQRQRQSGHQRLDCGS